MENSSRLRTNTQSKLRRHEFMYTLLIIFKGLQFFLLLSRKLLGIGDKRSRNLVFMTLTISYWVGEYFIGHPDSRKRILEDFHCLPNTSSLLSLLNSIKKSPPIQTHWTTLLQFSAYLEKLIIQFFFNKKFFVPTTKPIQKTHNQTLCVSRLKFLKNWNKKQRIS